MSLIRLKIVRSNILIQNLFSPVELYLSPIETHCSNIDYFPTIENGNETEESTRLHLARGVIALFALSFFAVICAFFTGLSGKSINQAVNRDWQSIFHRPLNSCHDHFLQRLLETIGRRHYSNRNFDAHRVSSSEWRNGALAHRWIFREGKSGRRGILPAVAERELSTKLKVWCKDLMSLF